MEVKNVLKDSKNNIQLSESTKLREPPKNEKEKLNENNQNTSETEPIEKLVQKMGETVIIVNRLDFFANTITLGAFCNAIAFVLYGFCESKVVTKNENFLFIILLLFGGIGQIVTGCLEYIKGRTFTTTLYITYGLFFISFFILKLKGEEFFNQDCKNIYYGSWCFFTFPLIIGSVKVNVFYIIQNLALCAFFVVRCIGESKNKSVLKEKVSGILELVGGFASMYIFISQIINEHYKRQIIPCIALQKDNEIDVGCKKEKQN